MTREQERALVREFSDAVVERHGVAIEFAIHKDESKRWDGIGKRMDGRHAHILMSTRPLLSNGFSKSKAREFSGLQDGPKTLEFWRQQWAEIGNRHLSAAGLKERWDHRALEVQREQAETQGDYAKAIELDRLPGVHLGAVATAFERRGIETLLGDLNRAIAAENLARRRAHRRKGVESAIEEFEHQLAALRKEQAQEFEPATVESDRIDPRWPEYERELMRIGTTKHKIDPRYLELALQVAGDRFVELADAIEAQGFEVSELARRMVIGLAEWESSQNMDAAALDEELRPESDDQDADFGPS